MASNHQNVGVMGEGLHERKTDFRAQGEERCRAWYTPKGQVQVTVDRRKSLHDI